MKNKEELNALKNEVEALRAKLAGLTDEEMAQVGGGMTSEEFINFIKEHNLIITKDDSEFGSLKH